MLATIRKVCKHCKTDLTEEEHNKRFKHKQIGYRKDYPTLSKYNKDGKPKEKETKQ